MSVDSESESGSEVEPFKLYRDRNEWSDITPVKQSDGDVPVVPMEYAENCKYLFKGVIYVISGTDKFNVGI